MKKTDILEMMRESGDFVSGQAMCDSLGISRTAIWKAIEALKSEGYEIEAVRNKGYRLIGSDAYSQTELESRFGSGTSGFIRPVFFDETDSTNAEVKRRAESGETEGLLVAADMQTAGRGRRGRDWSSPKGVNIYFSLLLKPDIPAEKAPMITLLMALAVAGAIGDECKIKWPNDVVIDGKKVCGILTEMSAEQGYVQYIVVGVGINVKVQEFQEGAGAYAGSIEQLLGRKTDRAVLLSDAAKGFMDLYKRFTEDKDLGFVKDEYNKKLAGMGGEVRVLDPAGEYKGVSLGINDKGELMIETEEGLRNVYAGEVSVRGLYGYV